MADDEITTELNLSKNTTALEKQKYISPRLARFRIAEQILVVWLDVNINDANKETRLSIRKLQHIVNSVKTFHDTNECIDFLTDLKNETVYMIISNDFIQWILPLINDIPQLHAIYHYDSNHTQPENWIQGSGKVKGLFIQIDAICNAVKRSICKSEIDSTLISIVPENSIINFDELDQSFMYSQILKETIIDIEHDEKAKEEFVNFCRGQYFNNEVQLGIVNTFERDYKLHSPIWWYTKEPFIYSTLNQALRKQDIEIIIKMGFFLQDLHRQIEHIHLETHQTTKITVYRGQGMINMEFEKIKNSKGGLLSFNNFLSTSIDEQVSLLFASSARDDPDLTGILFKMEIDPTVSLVPFAALDDISFYSDFEREILFSMHTIFRISDMIQIEDRLWQINLTLTSDSDQQLMHLATYIRNEIGDQPGWVRMAGLMLKMGKFDKTVEIYNTLLMTMTDDNQKKLITSLPTIYNNNAAAHASLGDYSAALAYLEITLEIAQKALPSNHPLLATFYNNIGITHRLSNDFASALSYYEKAIEIIQNSFPIDNIQLANSYQNMGDMYEALGHYSTALMYHEKTLEMDQTSLPSIHPNLATSYFKTGHLHELMGNYTLALSCYEKARKIEEKSLPPYHPYLASTYRIIGGVHHSMGEYSIALSYYEKTAEIEEKSLPPNHPDRAVTLSDIGTTYQSLDDYSTALSYHKKSLEIELNSISSDHLHLAKTYNNIGLALESMTDYPIALSYYKKTLELEQKYLPPDHPDLAITFSNIAGLYQSMEDYTTAISYYEKTLDIQRRSLESDHPDLAITYNDIGLAYKSIEDYSTALSYYEKTLAIQKIRLSPNHPHLAVTYHNLGDLNLLTEHYSTALSHYDTALQIKQKSLPPNHPTFAIIYNNIGEIYRTTEEYSTALTFYEKKLDIHLKSSSPNQSDIADTYKKIGLVHKSLEDYSTALSYYKKALEIQEEHLSSDDPELITSLYNMSTLLDKLCRYEEAIAYAERAVNIARLADEPDDSEIEEIDDHIHNLRQKL